MPSRSKGFFSMDAMLSMLPLMMLCLLFVQASSEMSGRAARTLFAQQTFDKLVSAADFTVKSGAVMRENGVRYPNWVDPALLDRQYSESLRGRLALASLYISLLPPGEEFGLCIYRIVVVGETKEISKLYVCGD